jgi:hypothetical protein
MSKKKELPKPKNIDDLLASMQGEHSKDLDAAFKAHDAYTKDENQNHIYNNILAKASTEMYNSMSGSLDKSFSGKDETKIKTAEHRKQVKKAISGGIEKYFEKAQPGVKKLMDGLNMSDDEKYDYLTSMYDDHVGVGAIDGVESIREETEKLMKKNKTVGHVKKKLYQVKGTHAEGARVVLQSKHTNHHFAKFDKTQVAAYLMPKLEKEGFEIEHKVDYATANLGNLLGLRKSLLEKEGHAYLKKKEMKKAA